MDAIKPVIALAAPFTPNICAAPVVGPLLTAAQPYALRTLTFYFGIPLALATVAAPSLPLLIPGGKDAKNRFKISLINNYKNLSPHIDRTLIFAELLGVTGFLMQRYGSTTIPTV